MAWSEAARKASAEVRRQHAGLRKGFAKQSARSISANTSLAARKMLARKIKAYRKDPNPYSEITRHEVLSEAAASTRLRNLKRLGRKRLLPKRK